MLESKAILCMIFVVVLMIFGVCVLAIILNHKHFKSSEKLTRYQINVSSQIDRSIPQILDLIINDCFNDYKVKFLLPLNLGHINSDKEDDIRRGLAEMVTSRISNNALEKLSQFYNIANIADIIADKIYITVMSYVVDHNKEADGIE